MPSVRLQLTTKLVLIGTRTTYQATGDTDLIVVLRSGSSIKNMDAGGEGGGGIINSVLLTMCY